MKKEMPDGNITNKELKCGKCGVPLEPMEAHFKYLKRQFKYTVPRCPKCGFVYISEDLANGRIKEVETVLEDK